MCINYTVIFCINYIYFILRIPNKLNCFRLSKFTYCVSFHTHRYLYPKSHPSGRHSQVDWSAKDIDETKYPKFSQGKVSEVILGAGDLMYIPSGWIHYVMNLNINWQCNARSGKSKGQVGDLTPCGF